MKERIKKQFKLNPQNLKAIGLGFVWAIGVTFVLELIGVKIPTTTIGIIVWIFMSYKYQKKFNKQKSLSQSAFVSKNNEE